MKIQIKAEERKTAAVICFFAVIMFTTLIWTWGPSVWRLLMTILFSFVTVGLILFSEDMYVRQREWNRKERKILRIRRNTAVVLWAVFVIVSHVVILLSLSLYVPIIMAYDGIRTVTGIGTVFSILITLMYGLEAVLNGTLSPLKDRVPPFYH